MYAWYIGLEVHKASITIAAALAEGGPAGLHGSCSSDADRFAVVLGRIVKERGLQREQVLSGFGQRISPRI